MKSGLQYEPRDIRHLLESDFQIPQGAELKRLISVYEEALKRVRRERTAHTSWLCFAVICLGLLGIFMLSAPAWIISDQQGVNDILHQDSFVFASLGLMLLALLLCGAALRYLLLHLANPAPDAAHPGRELDIVLYLQGAGLAEQILMDQFDFERFHASMGRLERWLRNCHVPGSAYERIRQLSTYLDVVFRERRRGEGGRKVLHFLLRIYLIGHFCMALLEISRSLERVSGICMLCGMLLIICGYLIAARNRWRFDNIGPEIHMELALRYYREVEDLDPGRLAMKRRRAKLPLRRNHFEAFQA